MNPFSSMKLPSPKTATKPKMASAPKMSDSPKMSMKDTAMKTSLVSTLAKQFSKGK